MSRRWLTGWWVAVALFVAVPALAADRPPAGVWEGENVSIVVFDCGPTFAGHIALNGQRLPFATARAADGKMAGQFVHQGANYDFAMTWDGRQGSIQSGKSVRPVKLRTADPFDYISQLVDKKDFAGMWAELQPVADRGAPHALFVAGLATEKGWGVPADAGKALQLYVRAADAGSNFAPLNAGLMYRDGDGCQPDAVKAREMFEVAAMRGDKGGGTNLAALILRGRLGPVDKAEAAAWLMFVDEPKAAQQLATLTEELTPEQLVKAKARAADLTRRRDAATATGTIRMGVKEIDGRITLVDIPEGGVLAQSGAKPGDVLVEIDKTPVAGKSMEEISGLIHGRAGSIIQLRFDRGGQNVMIACPREERGK